MLLIACINVANLLLAKGMSGQKELAVRIALGASRRTIFAQQLVESLLLAFAGGLLSVAVGFAMLHSIAALAPTNFLPHEADLRLNFPVLMVTFVTTISGLLFGSIPAWYASHVNPSETLKEGGRSAPDQGRIDCGGLWWSESLRWHSRCSSELDSPSIAFGIFSAWI